MMQDLDNGLAAKFLNLEDVSVEALTDYVKGGGGDKVQTQVARIAVSVLSVVQRRRSIELNRDRLYFAMAKGLTSDPIKLADYIRQTQPSSPFARLQPGDLEVIMEAEKV